MIGYCFNPLQIKPRSQSIMRGFMDKFPMKSNGSMRCSILLRMAF